MNNQIRVGYNQFVETLTKSVIRLQNINPV